MFQLAPTATGLQPCLLQLVLQQELRPELGRQSAHAQEEQLILRLTLLTAPIPRIVQIYITRTTQPANIGAEQMIYLE